MSRPKKQKEKKKVKKPARKTPPRRKLKKRKPVPHKPMPRFQGKPLSWSRFLQNAGRLAEESWVEAVWEDCLMQDGDNPVHTVRDTPRAALSKNAFRTHLMTRLELVLQRLMDPGESYDMRTVLWPAYIELLRDDPHMSLPFRKHIRWLAEVVVETQIPPPMIPLFALSLLLEEAWVAQKLGRRWIGCDINIGAIQTTTKRLNQIIEAQLKDGTGKDAWLLADKKIAKIEKMNFAFKVFNVNDYDVFKNEVEAKEIIMEMYGVEKARSSYFDGVLDNCFVKVMPLNRVLSKKDLDMVIKGIRDSLGSFDVKRKSRHGESVYEQGVIVFCSGLEMDALDYLKKKNDTSVEVDVRDILFDKQGVIFKQKLEAEISVTGKSKKVLVKIEEFMSPILMRKLEIENDKALKKEKKAKVDDFRQIVDSVAIDADYDGKLFNAEIIDVPAKNELIKGEYSVEYPKTGKKILAIKIVDVLGEEYFETFEVSV